MWVPSYVWIFYLICRIQQQQEVLAWLLEPINKMWTQVEWQNAYLSDPSGLTHMFADSQFMWSIYHNITLFEKALKRGGSKKSAAAPQALATTVVTGNLHPMCSHLPWILPPLLRVIWHFFLANTSFFFWCNYYVLAKLIAKYSFDITIFPLLPDLQLLRCIHTLWAEPFSQSTAEVKAAKSMTVAEQTSLLGETNKLTKGQVASADGLLDVQREGESKENTIRNWLRGIRDSG